MKILKKTLFLISFLILIPLVNAGSFTAGSSSTNPTVGSKVTITVNGSNLAGKFTVSSSNTSVLSGGGSIWVENGSNSVTFEAKSAGSTVITINASDVSDSSDGSPITGSKTINITVANSGSRTNNGGTNAITNNNTIKSSINYLTKLEIEGVQLSPAFDKNTIEYEVLLEPGTEKINVIAEKESSVSYVTGVGEVQVSEGVNFISVVVTAENGAKKTYIIKATVPEENPIIVNVDDKEMTLVKKSEAMPGSSDYYVLGSVVINDIEVPAYINDITGYVLVALKDSEGNVELYRYDKENASYSKYNEFGFNAIRISLVNAPSIPDGYKLEKIVINDIEVEAYTKENSYPLVYGINLETGKSSFYTYDSLENTIQRYEVNETKENSIDYSYYIILGLSGVIIFQFIIMIIVTISKNRKQKKKLRNKLDTKTEFEKNNESLSENTKNNDNSEHDGMYKF